MSTSEQPLTERLKITEIFHSIQGESTFMGLPCVFVRLTGCNLRCVWCDSAYTFSGGEWMTLAEILAAVDAFPPCEVVEVTGGEPLLQKNALPLMRALCDAGKTVLLETSGSLDLSGVDPRVRKIVDLKAPGSGEVERNRWACLDELLPHDELKIVVKDRQDYLWAADTIRNHNLHTRVAQVLLSPVFGECDSRELAEWILADALPVRMQLQLHKFIWEPNARGV